MSPLHQILQCQLEFPFCEWPKMFNLGTTFKSACSFCLVSFRCWWCFSFRVCARIAWLLLLLHTVHFNMNSCGRRERELKQDIAAWSRFPIFRSEAKGRRCRHDAWQKTMISTSLTRSCCCTKAFLFAAKVSCGCVSDRSFRRRPRREKKALNPPTWSLESSSPIRKYYIVQCGHSVVVCFVKLLHLMIWQKSSLHSSGLARAGFDSHSNVDSQIVGNAAAIILIGFQNLRLRHEKPSGY